jgi:Helix-turn-helix
MAAPAAASPTAAIPEPTAAAPDLPADRMGVDRDYISMIERGAQNATLISILEVAEALRVHPSVLLMEIDESPDALDSTKPRPAERGGV